MLDNGHYGRFIDSLEFGFNAELFNLELGIFLDELEDTDIPGEGFLCLEQMAKKLNTTINKRLAEKNISAKQAGHLLELITSAGAFDDYWFNVKGELKRLLT